MKEFKWQYSDEKILFKVRENLFSFIFSKIWFVLTFLVLIFLIWILVFIYLSDIFWITFIVLSLFLIVLYYRFLYKDSFLYFTSRRVIKQIRNGLFFKHRKELKIMDIKSSMSNKKWFLQTILAIWNLKIEWTEKEANIYFSWVKEYSELSNYMWRVVDYIKINGHTDNISRYQNKNTRKIKN